MSSRDSFRGKRSPRAGVAEQRPTGAVYHVRAAAGTSQAGVLEQQADRHDEHDAGDHPGGEQEQTHLVPIVVPAPCRGASSATTDPTGARRP